jgi:Transposase, Mutator family
MRYEWAEDTEFTEVVLTVEQEVCSQCQRHLHICDHRFHPILSLQGPLRLVCKLAHCPDPCCPAHGRTLSPLAEAQITLPYWLIGWDVFSWLGFRRFSRHWSIPQLQAELRDSYAIRLSDDAISGYLKRYRCMVAARHQDNALLAEHYKDIASLVLTIDGLQPEKGHETLYVVRELRGKRVWFAEALLSSSADEVRRLIARAKDWAGQLAKPVELWMSDKQDAFVTGIQAEFPDVPHRYCQNHFLRDLAKPVLEKDSHAKVQMRKKVRGLRDIEKQVLEDRRVVQAEAEASSAAAAAAVSEADGCTAKVSSGGEALTGSVVAASTAAAGRTGALASAAGEAEAIESLAASATTVTASSATAELTDDEAGQVVLDYCAAVRGILNDDQGGPLHPPGLRMAEALQEVGASLQRNLDAKKGGAARSSYANSRAASTGDCKRSRRSKSRSKSTSTR